MTAVHPADQELHDFLLGRLSDSAQIEVESHFADCDECRDRALSVAANDTLIDLLASAATKVNVERSAAPTPTLDGAATPPAFAPTLAWDAGTASNTGIPQAPTNHPKYRVIPISTKVCVLNC